MTNFKIGKDQLRDNLFYPEHNASNHSMVYQEFDDEVYEHHKIHLSLLAMDFPKDTSRKARKEIESEWIKKLPTLDKIECISVRHRVDEVFFDAICQMKNLKKVFFWSSRITDISSLNNLTKLEFLHIEAFSQLTDISPLLKLKQLNKLSIDNCFKINNYELVGELDWLTALSLEGDTFAPKNLRIPSLKPISNIKNLEHLQLDTTSVIDKSYEEILKLKKLVRLDARWRMKKSIRDKIKTEHKSLKSGFFMAYDFDNQKFHNGIEW